LLLFLILDLGKEKCSDLIANNLLILSFFPSGEKWVSKKSTRRGPPRNRKIKDLL
jgi:hypothetical protein